MSAYPIDEPHLAALRVSCQCAIGLRRHVQQPSAIDQAAAEAISIHSLSAQLARDLLGACGVHIFELTCSERLDGVVRIEVHPKGWQWAPVPLLEMQDIPALILALLNALALTEGRAEAALRALREAGR